MCIKATIVGYAFLVQCFENATIVAYAGLRVNIATKKQYENVHGPLPLRAWVYK